VDEAETAMAAIARLPNLVPHGLMTVARATPNPEMARTTFATLRLLRDGMRESTGMSLPVLSMGMTEDFEVAVEEGATMIRIGRALFGERPMAGSVD